MDDDVASDDDIVERASRGLMYEVKDAVRRFTSDKNLEGRHKQIYNLCEAWSSKLEDKKIEKTRQN